MLQYVINKTSHSGVLHHPLGELFGGDYPIVQYGDHELLVLPADIVQLHNLKEILPNIASYTGLRANFDKSFLVPNNVDESHLSALTNFLVPGGFYPNSFKTVSVAYADRLYAGNCGLR